MQFRLIVWARAIPEFVDFYEHWYLDEARNTSEILARPMSKENTLEVRATMSYQFSLRRELPRFWEPSYFGHTVIGDYYAGIRCRRANITSSSSDAMTSLFEWSRHHHALVLHHRRLSLPIYQWRAPSSNHSTSKTRCCWYHHQAAHYVGTSGFKIRAFFQSLKIPRNISYFWDILENRGFSLVWTIIWWNLVPFLIKFVNLWY